MPAVSVILPTFNRARFLPEAFAWIRAQTFTDWELIVVDDGSTDNTRELTADLSKSIPQPVRYIHQENRGAYGARNTGLDNATGRYLAFFDSDDLWLPHHLANCAAALAAHSEVSWVYGACRLVNEATGQVVAATSFRMNGSPGRSCGSPPRKPAIWRSSTTPRGPLRNLERAVLGTAKLGHAPRVFCRLASSRNRATKPKTN